jgi:hypothetical protein
LPAVKTIIKTKEIIEYFIIQPKRQTSILNLAESLNKIKTTIKKSEIYFFSSTERKSQSEDTVKLFTKSLNALTLLITAVIFKMKAIVVNISFNRQKFVNKSGIKLNLAFK